MGTGKTYSTKYLLDSNNSSGVAGQVLSTTSTGIDWVDANTVPGTGLWLANGNDIYNSNSGNVGIGVTSPNDALEVAGNSATTHRIRINNANASGTETLAFVQDTTFKSWVEYNNSTGNFDVWQYTNNPLRFATNNTERIRITSAGTLLLRSGAFPTNQDAPFLYRIGGGSLAIGSATETGSGAYVALYTNSLERMRIIASGNVGIGTTNPGSKFVVTSDTNNNTQAASVKINHSRSDANAESYALHVDANLSGADTTTGDRTNRGIWLDLDSSADGDASNEHRIRGFHSDVRFTGYSDLVQSGYFYAESNNSTEKTAQLVGCYGYAVHDSNSTNGGVSNMYGVNGQSIVQDLGDVDNAFGGYFAVDLSSTRGNAAFGVSKGVEGKVQINKAETVGYGTMIAVSSVIDNNEGTIPNFGAQYLFKGDYQGTRGGNAYGIYTDGDKHYFAGNVGIGPENPTSRLTVGENGTTTKIATATIADTTAGASLTLRGGSPTIYFDRTGTDPENKILMDSNGLEFKTGTLDAEGDVDFKIQPNGKLQAPVYTQGFLQSDANGNIDISGGGTLPGGPFLPLSAGSSYPLTGDLYLDDDSGASPSIYFKNEDDNFWRYLMETGGDFSIKEGTSTRLTFQAGGNVGIGTTLPESKLDVNGGATLSTGVPLRMRTNTTLLDSTEFRTGNGEFKMYSGRVSSSHQSFVFATGDNYTSGSTRMVILGNNGNVGIGTTSPDKKLTVNGSVKYNTQITTLTNMGQKAFIGISSGAGAEKFKIYKNTNTTDGYARFKIDRAFDYGNSDQMVQEAIFQRRNTTKNFVFKYEGDVATGDDVYLEVYELSDNQVEIWFCVDDFAQSIIEVISNPGTSEIFTSPSAGTPTGTLIHSSNPDTETPNWDSYQGDGYFAGNVGIGVTGPSTKLEVAGHVTINSPAGASQTSYGLRLRKTNSSSTVQAGGEILASVYPINTNAGNLIFKTANASANLAQRMVIDGIGNVGIGTTSPDNLLHLANTAGDAFIRMSGGGSLGDTYGGFIRGYGVAGQGGHLTLGVIDNNTFKTAIHVTAQSNEIEFSTAGTERMIINSAGAIRFNAYGAGTLVTDASGSITVSSGGGAGGPYLPLAGGDMTGGIDIIGVAGGIGSAGPQINFYPASANDPIGAIRHDGTDFIITAAKGNSDLILESDDDIQILASGGDILINEYIVHNNDPDTKFGFTAADQFQVIAGGNTNLNVQGNGVDLSYAGSIRLNTQTGGVAITGELITTGDVGIGVTNPSYTLEVDGTMFSSGNFGNRNDSQTIGVQFEPGSTSATTMAVYSDELKVYFKGPNTTRFEFEEDGTARKPGGGSWSSTSDERVKKDITNYTKGLAEILAIQPVNYKYNGKAGLPQEKQQVGVIAQDVQAAFPNAVETYKALFNEDDTEETELLAFNPSELTFTLINAVKELKAEIELLKQQINN